MERERGNGERDETIGEGKWRERGNGERMRKWRENGFGDDLFGQNQAQYQRWHQLHASFLS